MTNDITNYNKLLFDPKFRNDIRNNPVKCVALLGYDSTDKEGIEYVVKTNTKKVLYIAILDATYLKDEDMLRLQAAGKKGLNISTASSAGTVGSTGCVTTSISTVSTAGTAGSVGSVDV